MKRLVIIHGVIKANNLLNILKITGKSNYKIKENNLFNN